MNLRNTTSSYGTITKLLHWLMALAIIMLLIVGFVMSDMENSPDKFTIYGIHKAVGIIVLGLAVLRLGWRWANAVPVLPDTLKAWQKSAAHLGHWALYGLMIAMPLSGWAMSSAAGFPVSVFGWFTLPNLLAPDKALVDPLREIHEFIAYVIIGLVSLHVVAALVHHFYYRDSVLRRMLPFVLLLGLLAPATPGYAAEAQAYGVIKEKSTLKFLAIQNNAPVEGVFEEFTADIRFDPDLLDKSSIQIDVATGSVTGSYDEMIKNIKLPEWFSAEAFPKATFVSKKIVRMPSTDNYYAEGELTLRGKTAPVTVNFQLTYPTEKLAIAKGYATLHRNDFGVGQGQWAKDDVIKNEVRVEFRIAAEKK